MTLVRLASLFGVAVLVLVLNVAASVLYMVVYGHRINPGHPPEFYREHVKVAAPYCSIVVGIPLMFLAGFWVAGWWQGQAPLRAALVVWLVYAVIDLSILMAAGMTPRIAVLFTASFLTKLGAAYLGALVATKIFPPATLPSA